MAKVILDKLTKNFGNSTVVNNLDLEIEDKEFIVFVGPSGCGKTTTLRMIAGLEKATSGNMFIGDTLVNDLHPGDRNVAMVFQNYALYPHMTVFENLGFGLKLRKVPGFKIETEAKRIAKLVGIDKLLDRFPKQLSGGERQRVALGRALIRQPQAFLFDEPLSNLDAKLRLTMRGELIRLHRQIETTTIYVTHDQVEAMTLGDRVVVMREGQIQQVGIPSEIYRKPANSFVAGFVGSPPINLIEADLILENSHPCLSISGFRLRIPNKYRRKCESYCNQSVIFGIRPGDISIRPPEGGTYPKVTARVEVVEFIGNEVILEVATPTFKLIMVEDAYGDFSAGKAIDLTFNMDRMYLFNSDAGKRIDLT